MLDSLRRIVLWSFAVGGVAFAIGFFGPMIVAPEANQGPLLGILITGPLGAVAGLVVGAFREAVAWRATPLEVLGNRGITRDHLLRSVAGIIGTVLLLSGLREIAQSPDRSTAATIVVGAVLLWYTTVGRIPSWFRR
jgi:hypothetical protein